MENKILDLKYKLKKFTCAIFKEAIKEGNNLRNNEYIRVYQNNDKVSNQIEFNEFNKFSNTEYFKNIDDFIEFAFSKKNYHLNTYFNLATTTGLGGKLEDLEYRYCLGFDFDKKELGQDFNYKDILNLFNKIKLHYHILVDSGNGFHAYVLIEPTKDHKLVEELTKVLTKKLNADLNACKTTQVLRVPYSWNVKDKRKRVNIISCDENIYRYNIEKLAKKYCRDVKSTTDNTNIKYLLDTKIPSCIAEILKNGSKDGCKNADLKKIVVALRMRNKTLNQLFSVAQEWNNISENSFSNNELNYQVEYMYNNLRSVDFGCSECNLKKDCWSRIESDFVYSKDDILLNVAHKHMKDLKYKNRKGAKIMDGNQLFIYNVLLNNKDRELNVEEITELITYKKKNKIKNVAMSEKTLRDTLKELLENDYVKKQKGNTRAGIQDTYKVNEVRCKLDKQFTISYFATLSVIWGIISTEELRLYTHMRYKQDLLVKEGKAKGNILRINQEELAKDLGVTQQRISDMLDGLLEAKIINIWETKINENGFMYYTYKLNK